MRETESAGGVVERDGKIVVVSQQGNFWSLPKGRIGKGESKLDAAKREIYEESGIKDLELVGKLGTYKRIKIHNDVNEGEDREEMKTITMFHFKTDQKKIKPMDSHNPEARWVEKEKVVNILTHPKDKEFFLSIKDKI